MHTDQWQRRGDGSSGGSGSGVSRSRGGGSSEQREGGRWGGFSTPDITNESGEQPVSCSEGGIGLAVACQPR